MQVVLPQPEGPTMATNSRSCTSRLTSFSATKAWPFWWNTRSTPLKVMVAKGVFLVNGCGTSRQRPRRASMKVCSRRSAMSMSTPTAPMATMPLITVAVDTEAWPLTIR